jgi:group I intron endonuclease
MGVIYCITSPSGKKYIGQTHRKLQKRINEHKKMITGCIALNNAIQKYGFETFQIEILLEINDKLLNLYESKFIDAYQTIYPNGYNIRSGGCANSKHCDESRERMRQSKMGNKNPNFGKPRSETTKSAISNAKSGEKHHFFGKNLSFQHKLNLSKSHKKDNLPMYMVKIKGRPEHYTSDGYAITNHPNLNTKYFTSKKLTDIEKYNLALDYLQNGNMDAVQRLNGDGSLQINNSVEV